ncbi:MAG: ATP-binding protein [Vicinamibacterales bacterium]
MGFELPRTSGGDSGQVIPAASPAGSPQPEAPVAAARPPGPPATLPLSILDAAANAIVITSATGEVQWANRAFLTLTGYAATETVGHTPGQLVRSGCHPRSFYEEMWNTILAGRVWRGEVINRRKDGSLYEEDMTITPVLDEAGRVVQFVAVKQDVTERNQLRARLADAERLESIGRLAGGVAHDFNNLLTVITSYASLARTSLDSANPLVAQLEEIERAGERAALLTRQLLAFSRGQTLTPAVLDLNRVVSTLHHMLARLIGEHMTLEVIPGGQLWAVRVDLGQIQQVIVNLVVNARDAMPAGGTITISTGNVVLGDSVALACGVAPGDYVALEVSDTGTGIPPDVYAHMFEPFFTTKPEGRGTGLGLSTVHGVVRQSGGAIDVRTAADRGTTFRVLLPRVLDAVTHPQASVSTRVRRGSGTLLIVEDDESVRQLTAAVAETAGYDVITAEHGHAALEVLRCRPVDLVVSDVVMPGMPGPELARRAAAVRPGLRFLFMSGYADERLRRQLSGAPLLCKPFQPVEFARVVGELLDAPRP